MLISAVRKDFLYQLRVAIYSSPKKKQKFPIARCYTESKILSTSMPQFTSRRTYNSNSNTKPKIVLPMLIDGAVPYTASILAPLKLFYLATFEIIPYIDKEFDVFEIFKGTQCAISVISKALANMDFEFLQDLVAKDAIEAISAKIETLSPDERQLIALNEDDIIFYMLNDVNVAKGDESFIKLSVTCHYSPDFKKRKHEIGWNLEGLSTCEYLACNYTFTRQYVNNIGGSWIATFVNHYSL